ncbi:hypothetical protein ccbrp13_31490 [Ktedonobacteria bacterium brp13]|nr:hypothetical protein ccbrp13_31490 [Ktedonobacteria bacterium brp13]
MVVLQEVSGSAKFERKEQKGGHHDRTAPVQMAHELRNELAEELSVGKGMTNCLKLDRMHMRTGRY